MYLVGKREKKYILQQISTCMCTCMYIWNKIGTCTIRAPVFGRHQFFGTSEHYRKAHGSLSSGWINYNYTECCWFPTSSNILILPSQFWSGLNVADCTLQSAEYWCFYGTCIYNPTIQIWLGLRYILNYMFG